MPSQGWKGWVVTSLEPESRDEQPLEDLDDQPRGQATMKYSEGAIIRNTTAARVNHWITARTQPIPYADGQPLHSSLIIPLDAAPPLGAVGNQETAQTQPAGLASMAGDARL